MNLTTPSKLAKQIGVTRQATSLAIKNGSIPFVLQGKKKFVDLDDPAVQLYISDNSIQRERAAQSKKKPSEKPAQKAPKKPNPSQSGKKNSTKSSNKQKQTNENTSKITTPSDLPELSPGDLSAFDLNQREKIAKVQLAEIKVEIMEKNNLPKDFIQDGLFAYLTKLNSNIERLMGIMIKDVGQSILQDKEVAPKHIDAIISKTLRLIDDTKKQILKAIKKYEPKL